MQKSRMRTLTSILSILTIFGCSEQVEDNKTDKQDVNTPSGTFSVSQTIVPSRDSIDFLDAIKGLEDIKFYIGGLDSIAVTRDPTDLIELNTMLNAFYDPFTESDTGLIKYKTVELLRKYHVERKDGKTGARPSANIIQLSFKDTQEAAGWFTVYDNSPEKQIIRGKPKTELWLDDNKVYFVQTYHTPQRDYVDFLKTTLIEKIKKQKSTGYNKK